MKPIIIIGKDEGKYEFTAGTRVITLSAISFTPTLEGLSSIVNLTQNNKLYYSVGENLGKCTINGNDITIDSDFDPLQENDKIRITFFDEDAYIDRNQSALRFLRENTEEKSYLPLESKTLSGINDRIYFRLRSSVKYRKTDIAYALSDTTGFSLKILATWNPAATYPTDGADYSSAWKDITTEALGGAISGTTLESSHGIFEGMPHEIIAQVTLQNADGSSVIEWRNFNF